MGCHWLDQFPVLDEVFWNFKKGLDSEWTQDSVDLRQLRQAHVNQFDLIF